MFVFWSDTSGNPGFQLSGICAILNGFRPASTHSGTARRSVMLYPLWFLVVTLGYFVKGTAGFGNSPIHTGLMAFFMNNADLTPVDYVLTMPANIALTVRHRKYLIPKLWIASSSRRRLRLTSSVASAATPLLARRSVSGGNS